MIRIKPPAGFIKLSLSKGAVRLGSLVLALALLGLLVYLVYPIPMFFDLPLSYADNVVSYGNCQIKRVPYNCRTEMQCEEKCVFWFLVCLKAEKVNCKAVEICDYKNEISCSAPASYSAGQQQVSCPSGTIYANGQCINPYSPNSYSSYYSAANTQTCRDVVTEKTRLVCGGDVLENKYIRGFRYIQEQTIRTTCNTCGSCKDEIVSTKNKVDCVASLTYPKVCRDDSTPKCVAYPLELKISTILDQIKNLLKI